MTKSAPVTAPDAGDAWRDQLGGYLTAGTEERAEGPQAAPENTPMALQFELRELIPRTVYRWNGPMSKAVKAAQSGELRGDHRLGVRPAARTARGWARGTMTWSNLPHLPTRLRLDPDQHRWFCEFVALSRAGAPAGPARDPDWVFLDGFTNPVLWALLDQAVALGIALVGVGAAGRIRRAERAMLTLDAVRDEEGVHLGPLLTFDTAATPVTQARAIGAHGLYATDPAAPRHIVLAPVAQPLSPEQLAILGPGTGKVDVPPDAVEEFVRDYLPELVERIDVSSSDSSVVLPPPAQPLLVATVTHGSRHTLSVDWHWAAHRRSGAPPPVADVIPAGLLPEDWVAAGNTAPPGRALRGMEAAEFATRVLPLLPGVPGLRVRIRGTAPAYRELTGTPRLTVTAIPSEKHDWFDLGVTVTIDDRTIPFVPLFKALAKGRRKLLLVDGTYFSLDHPALRDLIALIDEARDIEEWEPVPSISRHQISLWSDFEDLADEAVPAVQWRALLAEARRDTPAALEPPGALRADLRPYQREGFSWLSFLWRHQLGGILADDMGLGKTLQCLALIQHVVDTAPRRRPFLVIAPTSVVLNWISEAARFAPELVVRHISATEGVGKDKIADAAQGADIVVTSYALLRLDFDAYQAVAQSAGWAGLVLDETQFVKNPGSKLHQCALDLQAGFKLALTGTPLENSLRDLQALFAVVAPGLFPSAPRFMNDYVRPIEQARPGISRGAGDAPAVTAALRAERLAKLRRRVRPSLLRRNKELVAADLPEKQEQTLRIDLAPEHRDLYDVFLQRERQKLFRLLEDLDRNKFIVFRSLTLLRLLALDASLISDEYAAMTSRKLEALFEQLDDVIAEGHRALVFSQFTSYLKKVSARLDDAGIAHAYLDGSTRDRQGVIDGFKDGSAPVFLISLKAGGFGLNLTEADYVFLLDPWWNPASEEQAVDRAHRIGQRKQVMVYRLVAAGTIEEKVQALKDRKAALFDSVINDEALFSSPLSADDIRELLC